MMRNSHQYQNIKVQDNRERAVRSQLGPQDQMHDQYQYPNQLSAEGDINSARGPTDKAMTIQNNPDEEMPPYT